MENKDSVTPDMASVSPILFNEIGFALHEALGALGKTTQSCSQAIWRQSVERWVGVQFRQAAVASEGDLCVHPLTAPEAYLRGRISMGLG